MGNKLSEISNKIKNLPIPGKIQAFIKGLLFVNIALFTGLWLGIKIFFPDDFILSKINEQLFVYDLALVSENVEISLFGKISFEDGALLQKGNKAVTFSKLSFSPALFKTLGGRPAGKLHLEDINSQGGELDSTFDTDVNPCYSLDASEIPLSVLKPFMAEVILTGSINGGGELCKKDGKYSGNIELNGEDVVLRGKVPTPMGDFDVGKIILGEIGLATEIVENKAEIKQLSVKGVFELDATGKVSLNTKIFQSSRLDLDVSAKVPDMAKIAENIALNLLVSQLSQYKGDSENSFAFALKGFLNKPQISKAARKDRDNKSDTRLKKPERPQRLQRFQRPENLQQKNVEKIVPQAPAANENIQQNDDLKKKEDELKRKEEELKRKEEAAKEREEKMREEREQREKEESERREQEEKKRMEEEARIHAVQEEAMNEIRRAREEVEAAKKARENQDEGGEAEPPKPGMEDKNENEEE